MFFDGSKNRKLRDEGTQQGERVNSALVEFTMNALVELRDGGHHDTLQYLHDAAQRGEQVRAGPHFVRLDGAGMVAAGGRATMDVARANALLDDDNQHLRQDAYPIIRAALVPQEGGTFRLQNPLDPNDRDTQILEMVTEQAKKTGFNTGGTWRDRLDPPPGPQI